MDLVVLLWAACVNESMVWHRQVDDQNCFWQFLISKKYQVFFCHFLPNILKSQQWRILHGLRPEGHWAGQQSAVLELLFQAEPQQESSILSCFTEASPGSGPSCLSLGIYISSLTQLWYTVPATGGWVLFLSTRTPWLDPAGTSSPLPRARRSFHCIFPVVTPFPWCCGWPRQVCPSGSGQQCSSSLGSFNKCVWKRLLAGEVWRLSHSVPVVSECLASGWNPWLWLWGCSRRRFSAAH